MLTAAAMAIATEGIDLVAGGRARPIIEAYALDRIHDAFARVESGKVRFRAVLQLPQA
jgi:propanol-preferring alcohol dehydrogenase